MLLLGVGTALIFGPDTIGAALPVALVALGALGALGVAAASLLSNTSDSRRPV